MAWRCVALALAGGPLQPGAEAPLLWANLSLFIYSVAYELSIVVLPYLNELAKGDSHTYAALSATVAVLQLVGGILFGRFGDVFTGRQAILVAHVASASSYALMSAAWTLPMVFCAMIPTVLQHGFQAAQMIIVDVTECGAPRSAALSLMGLSYGVGAIAGPAIAGVLAKRFGLHATAGAGAGSELVLVALLAACLGDTRTQRSSGSGSTEKPGEGSLSQAEGGWGQRCRAICSVADFRRILGYGGVRTLLSIHLGTQLSQGLLSTMMPLFAVDVFKLEPEDMGGLLAFRGVAGLLSRLLLGALARDWGDGCFMRIALVLSAGAAAPLLMETQAAALQRAELCGSMLLLCVSSSFMYAVAPGILTRLVPAQDTGSALGLDMATGSIAGIICPLLSDRIYRDYGFRAVALMSLAGSSVACVVGNLTLDNALGQALEGERAEEAELAGLLHAELT